MKKHLSLALFVSSLFFSSICSSAKPHPHSVRFADEPEIRTVNSQANIHISIDRLRSAKPQSPARKGAQPTTEQLTQLAQEAFCNRFSSANEKVICANDTLALVKGDNNSTVIRYRFYKGYTYRKNDDASPWKREDAHGHTLNIAEIPVEIAVDTTQLHILANNNLEYLKKSVTFGYTLSGDIPLTSEGIVAIKKLLKTLATIHNDDVAHLTNNNSTQKSYVPLITTATEQFTQLAQKAFNKRFHDAIDPNIIARTDAYALVKGENNEVIRYRFHEGCIYRKADNGLLWKREDNNGRIVDDAAIPKEVAIDDAYWKIEDDNKVNCCYNRVELQKILPSDSSPSRISTGCSKTIPLAEENRAQIEELLNDVDVAMKNRLQIDVEVEAAYRAYDSRYQLLPQHSPSYIPLFATAALIGATEYAGWATKASDIVVEKTGLKRFVQKHTPKMILSNPKTAAVLVAAAAGTGAAFIPYKKEYMLLKALLAAWPTYKLMHAALKKNKETS